MGKQVIDDNYEEIEVEETEVGDVTEEEMDEEIDEETDEEDNEGDEDDESSDEDGEGAEDKPGKGKNDAETEVKFDKGQQKKVNEIINDRLARAEAKWERGIMEAAGVEMDIKGGELNDAVRLWGFLKANEGISKAVDNIIDQFVKNNVFVQPKLETSVSKEQELEVKEAMIDLKASDKIFAKNAKKVLEWAEDEGFVINSEKALRQAYLAWKGENMQSELANKELREQQKARQKQNVRSKAALQSGKTGASSMKKTDYRKMSDMDILKNEGLSLFTEK